jgi:4-alpha-glucanotransferase
VSEDRPWLAGLAEWLGVLPSYWDLAGRARPTSDATREALVAAMGSAVRDEEGAAHELVRLEHEAHERCLAPVLVWREWAGAVPSVPVEVPRDAEGAAFRLELREEGGERHVREGRLPPCDPRDGRVALALPVSPPPGYHELHLALDGKAHREATQRFVMAPRTALGVDELPGAAGSFGLWANLYTVRSAHDWGVGNLGDLGRLLDWCAELGGAFVGVNPLHAVANRGLAITPYSPTSRLYRNVLYLDVEAVPELRECPAAQALLRDPAFRARRERLRAAQAIDHGALLDLELTVLREVFAAVCARGEAAPRAREFARFQAREGDELRDFATWEALADHLGAPAAPYTDWYRWPAAWQDPEGPAVAAFRREHAHEIAFREWLQFELDAQLATVAARGRAARMPVGVYHDVAVGSARDSADTWMAQRLFARGVSVGAPPDDYAPEGQNWGFPPLDPHRLRADGYRFFARLLRAGFAHAGALRLDHAMGLLRLFWIPEGRSGSEGAYVRYPFEDLLGVLALESRRAGALVVAEDLGTVPDGFRETLAEWAVLGSSVVYFERDARGFRAPGSYPSRALATVETHDLVPLAGHRAGSDLVLRRAAGDIPDDRALAVARASRERDHEALLDLLRRERLLPPEGEPDAPALCAAVHTLLARSPAALVAASLDDLAGETEPVNLPGVPVERHRSWSRRMRRSLEALRTDPGAAAGLAPLVELRGRKPAPARRDEAEG